MFKSNKLIIFLISLPFQCFRQSQSNFYDAGVDVDLL